MSLDWLPRDNELKDHQLIGDQWWGTEAPCTVYEKRPLVGPTGAVVDGLYVAWITLNNPKQYNSYTTTMVKGVIAGFHAASGDRSVVAVIFTGAGDAAFCTGGNVPEYSSYYSKRPNEYGEYMDLFNHMVDSILDCKKPVICRVNGMRVAGGQEIGLACDLAVTSDMAVFGQAGPKHGSAPAGGSTDFLPWFLSMEDAMYNCISCEMWSAYKMKAKSLVSKIGAGAQEGRRIRAQPDGPHRAVRARRRDRVRRTEGRRRSGRREGPGQGVLHRPLAGSTTRYRNSCGASPICSRVRCRPPSTSSA